MEATSPRVDDLRFPPTLSGLDDRHQTAILLVSDLTSDLVVPPAQLPAPGNKKWEEGEAVSSQALKRQEEEDRRGTEGQIMMATNANDDPRSAAAVTTDSSRANTATGGAGATSSSPSSSFPYEDLQPRLDTNALSFVQRYPAYDGRNVRIGILDTGIFPWANGLVTMRDKVTPKLVDLIDCTGSGDVETFPVNAEWVPGEQGREGAAEEGHWSVKSPLTGRTLLLSNDWTFCPFPDEKKDKVESSSSETPTKADEKAEEAEEAGSAPTSKPGGHQSVLVRVGVKRAYELFPRSVRDRVKSERGKALQESLAPHVAQWRSEVARITGNGGSTKKDATAATLTFEQARERDNAKAMLEQLTAMETNMKEDDPGPLYDVVMWYDGRDCCCVVNTDCDNNNNNSPSSDVVDLRNETPLYSFAKRRQVLTCGVADQMKMAVNVHDHSVVSLVADVTPHGTHVAGIAAAAETSHDEKRFGVAPGAEIVGLKIGDTRLGSMETGPALARAMKEAVRLKCDVVNLSYGEGTCMPNTGHLIRLIDDLVWKHNVVFVSSAGNNGPALTTVGAPGGTTESVLGVAAYVSPHMMRTDYSLPLHESDPRPASDEAASEDSPDTISLAARTMQGMDEVHRGTTFTWSSVGPTADGALGVDVTAPGAAITSVSHWCLQKSMLMNGTSMSSPHATGCVALLVSACKALDIPVTPTRIKRAIMNTAKPIGHLSQVQQGSGMIQVDKAFEHLVEFKDDPTEDVHFAATISDRVGDPRGVYLRNADETSKRHTFSVQVTPNFRREDVVTEESQQQKISFEMAFDVSTEAPSWVTVPANFMLMNNGRSFKIDVDPSRLSPGLHTANVLGKDASNPNRGSLFSVPITVVKPLPVQRRFDFGTMDLAPAQVQRYFLTPPAGSTWMDVTITDTRPAVSQDGSSRLLVLHAVQLLPHAAYRNFEKQRYVTLLPSQSAVTSIAVEQLVTVEVDVGRFWSTIGDTSVSVTVEFRGIRPSPSDVTVCAGNAGALVRLHSELGDELVSPSAKLSTWRTPLRPASTYGVVPVLSERDAYPFRQSRVHEIVLQYEFKQEEKGSFTPIAPALQGVLYESAFESQLMLAFDGEKKYLGTSDAFPSAISAPKGTVTIRVQVRHADPKKLECLKDLTLWIERKLEKEIPLSAYESKESLMQSSDTFRKRMLRRGTCASSFIAHPGDAKIPSICKPGDVLLGTVTYESPDPTLQGDGNRPGGFPVTLVVGPKQEKGSSEPEAKEPEDLRTVDQKLADAVRDLKISHLNKLTAKEKENGSYDALYGTLVAEYPDHLPLLMTRLQYLDAQGKETTERRSAESLKLVVAAVDAVLALIDQDALSGHFGRKIDSEDPLQVKERKDMKERKSQLCDALAIKAHANFELDTTESQQSFSECMRVLAQWVDVDTTDRYSSLALIRAEKAGYFGLVLQRIEKLLVNHKEASAKEAIRPMTKLELYAKRIQVWNAMGLLQLVELDKRGKVVSSPKAFALF